VPFEPIQLKRRVEFTSRFGCSGTPLTDSSASILAMFLLSCDSISVTINLARKDGLHPSLSALALGTPCLIIPAAASIYKTY
jgi:hypothetical protein